MFMKQGPELHFITVDTCEITTECHRNLKGALQVWVGRNAYKSLHVCVCEGVHMRALAPPPAGCAVRCAPVSE